MADDVNVNFQRELENIINRDQRDIQDRMLSSLDEYGAIYDKALQEMQTNMETFNALSNRYYENQFNRLYDLTQDFSKFEDDLRKINMQNDIMQKEYTQEIINKKLNSVRESISILEESKKDDLNKQLLNELRDVAKNGGKATKEQITRMAKIHNEINKINEEDLNKQIEEEAKILNQTGSERLTKAKQEYAKELEAKFDDIDTQIAEIYEKNKGKDKWDEEDYQKINQLEEERRILQHENATRDYEIRKKYIISQEELRYERQEASAKKIFELQKKYSTFWSDTFKEVASNVVKEVFEVMNRFTDIYLFNQLKKGIDGYANEYESRFTEIAGRIGSASRKETDSFIKSTLGEVHGNSVLNRGLNFNKDVFPEITNAVKAGFTGNEAQDIAITNAVDKKIMPWLETSSETWTSLQWQLGNDNLEMLKGQQLLLQESKTGNMLLQTGVVNQITESLKPALLNIDANTTDTASLSAEAQAVYAFLREQGNYSHQDAIKITNEMINAYQNPYEAITSNSVATRMMGIGSLNGDSMSDVFAPYLELYSRAEGMDGIQTGAYTSSLGITTNGWTRDDTAIRNLMNPDTTLQQYIDEFKADPNTYKNKYESAENNLPEYNTATAEYDNQQENWAANIAAAFATLPHGFDILNTMYDELKSIKDWLFRSFLGQIAGDGLQFLFNRGGARAFGSGGSSGSGGGLGGLGNAASNVVGYDPSKGLIRGAAPVIKGASILGGITGAATGIYETYTNSTEYTNMSLQGKDAAINTAEYEAYKQALEDKHKAKMAGSITGGIIGGTAGALGGMAAGAAVGAAVGTVVPGLGNAVGAIVGGIIGFAGGIIGAKAGEAIGDAVSPLQSILSDAAVESLSNLDILQNNFDDELLERQNLLSAMQSTTDIEVQKRMLLDAGIDRNLVNMAKTDEALDKLAESALQASQDNSELANAAEGLMISMNNSAVADTMSQLESIVLSKDSSGRRDELTKILNLTDIDADIKDSILKDIKDSSDWFGTYDGEVSDIMGRIQSAVGEKGMRAIAGNYNLTYDTVNSSYFNELNQAILDKDKDAAIDAIKMLKADKLTDGSTSWDKIKQNDTYKTQLSDLGIDVSQYKLGSSFIPEDQLAIVHRGERVLTSEQNKTYSSLLTGGLTSSLMGGLGTDLLLNMLNIKSSSSTANTSSSLTESPIKTDMITGAIQDVVLAIEKQTETLVSHISKIGVPNGNTSIANMLSSFGNSSTLPTLGNIRVLAEG